MEKLSEQTKRYDTDAVKEWLRTYPEKQQDIRNMQAQYERLEDKLSSIGSPTLSDMPKSPSRVMDKEAELIAQKVDLEKEIEMAKKDVHQLRVEIEKVMSCLKKANEKAVIRARYLCEEEWNDISFILFGAKEDYLDKEESYERRTYMIHGSALLNMAKYIEDNKV